MTVNSNTPLSINTLANTQNIQQLNAATQSIRSRDRAEFSETAKQLAQGSQQVHSQSGASGTWTQPPSMVSPMLSNFDTSIANSTNDFQSLLMKTILSAYNSTSQSNLSSISLMA